MKPTEAQLGTLARWFRWHMTNDKRAKAINWLEENATRKQVSEEIARIHDLYHDRRLNEDNCFASDIWQGFNYKPPVAIGEIINGN